MIDIQEYIDRTKEYIDENRNIVLIVAGGLLAVLVLILILMIASDQKSRAAKKAAIDPKKLVIDQPLLVPDGPTVPNGYITSRTTEKNWSENNVEQWFTQPDQTEVEKLGEANDRIINEIIGAAP